MARIAVNQLRGGDAVDQVFIVRDCQFNTTKAGQPFVKMTLSDASGSMGGIYWDVPEAARQTLAQGRFLRVKGTVNTYNNALQVTVQQVAAASMEGLDTADFLPTTDKDVQATWKRLKVIMATVENRYLVELIRGIFTDREFSEKFKRAPAASQMHHAYIGGLLEHTTSMAEAALKVCEHYTDLNRDLLLVGVLVHDMGKVEEFEYETSIEYSDKGRLVGHVAAGLAMLEKKAAAIEGFPGALLDVLRHYILSHHGEAEFGALRQPMTAEAIALHYIDNLDAKLSAFYKATSEHPVATDSWTSYQKMFEGYLYRPDVAGGTSKEARPSADKGTGEADGEGEKAGEGSAGLF